MNQPLDEVSQRALYVFLYCVAEAVIDLDDGSRPGPADRFLDRLIAYPSGMAISDASERQRIQGLCDAIRSIVQERLNRDTSNSDRWIS